MTPLTPEEREAVWRWLVKFTLPKGALQSELDVNDAKLARLAMRYLDEGEQK